MTGHPVHVAPGHAAVRDLQCRAREAWGVSVQERLLAEHLQDVDDKGGGQVALA